ncbi:DinB family protein [Paenibacillus sp. CAA11]|uniref:DinB family protein n=1 Tax=Paenibacillus sp. CAA11 TaxID=1532905 RepID=UPI00131F26FA|nr:DinB family protein [Paenibacillus sp. CAA11]
MEEQQDFKLCFLKITLYRMTDTYWPKLRKVLESLNTDQLWAEPYPGGNSIGGIALHVCEHLHRSCLRMTGSTAALSSDFQYYFPDAGTPVSEVLQQLEGQWTEWAEVINSLIQEAHRFTEEHLHHLYHLVEHTGYHLGQIIDRAQGITGTFFRFYDAGLSEQALRVRIEEDRRGE